MAAARVCGKFFFKILQHRRILRRVKGARADVGKPQSLQQPRHRAFVVMRAEALFDPRRQIIPPPTHHPVHLGIGTALDDRRQALQLRRRQLHRRSGQGAVQAGALVTDMIPSSLDTFENAFYAAVFVALLTPIVFVWRSAFHKTGVF